MDGGQRTAHWSDDLKREGFSGMGMRVRPVVDFKK